jgi:hypothetical protein
MSDSASVFPVESADSEWAHTGSVDGGMINSLSALDRHFLIVPKMTSAGTVPVGSAPSIHLTDSLQAGLRHIPPHQQSVV